jgi:soluble lytic murein transglycosylase-like protein
LIALYISLFLFWIFKYSEAIAEPYTPNKQDFTKLERLEPIPEPKPVNIPPKPKTLAREAKKDQIAYNGSCYDYVDEMATKYNVDGEVMRRIIKAESGGNPNAKNKNSTASGCSQFIKSTWEGTLRQMGREYVSPFDPRTNVEAMAFKISRGGINAWNASKSKWDK